MTNATIGRSRQIQYCGNTYFITEGEKLPNALKSPWKVVIAAGSPVDPNRVLRDFASTLSRAKRAIHEHAVESGCYAAEFERTGSGPTMREIKLAK